MKTVHIVGGGGAYEQMFKKLGFVSVEYETADLVCFTGGEDVTPSFYGDAKHPWTGNNPARDEQEAIIFNRCILRGTPMVGICRGGQFLNVMSGGRMYQHVDAHTRSHMITDSRTGREVFVSSTHHQMFMPSSEALLVAYSTLGGGREWYDGYGGLVQRDVSNTDYEVLFYANTKALCFQSHPEFCGDDYDDMLDYFESLINEFLIKEAVCQ
jgi:carbamoylphosphate synthase small subunit